MRSRKRGFSVVELSLVAFLGTMISLALLLAIASSGYAQTRTDRLFSADMVLSAQAERAFRQSYDSLNDLAGDVTVDQNGFNFKLTTSVKDLEPPSPEGAKKVFILVTWQDSTAQGNRARNVLRLKRW